MPSSFAFLVFFTATRQESRSIPGLSVLKSHRQEGIAPLAEDCLAVEISGTCPTGFVLPSRCIQATANTLWPVIVVEAPSEPSSPAPAQANPMLRRPQPGRAEHRGSGNRTPLSPHAFLIFALSSFACQILLHHYHITNPLRCLPLSLRPALLHRCGRRLRGPDGPSCPAERGLEGAGSQGRTTPD